MIYVSFPQGAIRLGLVKSEGLDSSGPYLSPSEDLPGISGPDLLPHTDSSGAATCMLVVIFFLDFLLFTHSITHIWSQEIEPSSKGPSHAQGTGCHSRRSMGNVLVRQQEPGKFVSKGTPGCFAEYMAFLTVWTGR